LDPVSAAPNTVPEVVVQMLVSLALLAHKLTCLDKDSLSSTSH
jgi:hypothetical protein